MKILHAADLHLDSPFCGSHLLSAEDRREAQRALLARVFECAKQESCDLMLLAGDIFDGKYVTPETERLFLRLLEEAEYPVVIAPGNHDPYAKGSLYRSGKLPEHVYVFSSTEVQCFEPEGLDVRIFGYAFLSAAVRHSPLAGASAPEKEGYLHLLCAHADIENPVSPYAPLTEADIEAFGIDYAALGHVHNPLPPKDGGHAVIRYSGFAEGRSFDEEGDGGVLLVTLERDAPVKVERKILSKTRYVRAEVDVSGCDEDEELLARVGSVCESYGRVTGTHLRLTLIGAIDAEMVEMLYSEKDSVLHGLASLELRDQTLPVADGKQLMQDITLRGAFYKALLPQLVDDDPEVRRRAALSLQIGLAAIDGKRIPGRRDEE